MQFSHCPKPGQTRQEQEEGCEVPEEQREQNSTGPPEAAVGANIRAVTCVGHAETMLLLLIKTSLGTLSQATLSESLFESA